MEPTTTTAVKIEEEFGIDDNLEDDLEEILSGEDYDGKFIQILLKL